MLLYEVSFKDSLSGTEKSLQFIHMAVKTN